MAIDHGSKRVGIALSDPLRMFAKPFKVIENKGFKQLLNDLKQIIAEQDVGLVILGMPYTVDGGNSAKTIEVQDFYAKIRHKLGITVITRDERYSTSDAITELKLMGIGQQESRKLRDAMAAAMILKSYLEGLNQ